MDGFELGAACDKLWTVPSHYSMYRCKYWTPLLLKSVAPAVWRTWALLILCNFYIIFNAVFHLWAKSWALYLLCCLFLKASWLTTHRESTGRDERYVQTCEMGVQKKSSDSILLGNRKETKKLVTSNAGTLASRENTGWRASFGSPFLLRVLLLPQQKGNHNHLL